MSPETVIAIGSAAMKITILIAAPVLISTMVIGLLIGVLQAATQIQEMTLTFVPKIIVAALVLLFLGPWMIRILVDFTTQLIRNIPVYIR